MFLLVLCSLHSRILTFAQLVMLRGFVIACPSIQLQIVALESDININKSVLLPMREPNQKHASQHVAPYRGSVFALPPRKIAKRNFHLMCA